LILFALFIKFSLDLVKLFGAGINESYKNYEDGQGLLDEPIHIVAQKREVIIE